MGMHRTKELRGGGWVATARERSGGYRNGERAHE
jgi:hypothetical protein